MIWALLILVISLIAIIIGIFKEWDGEIFIVAGIVGIVISLGVMLAIWDSNSTEKRYNELMSFARTHDDSLKVMIEFKKPSKTTTVAVPVYMGH